MNEARSVPGTHPGTHVDAEVQAFITSTRLCYVATVSPDGLPNVSPKGSLKVIDEHTVAFADMASPRTVRNIAHNPNVEINVVDPFLRRGYRMRGRAEVADDPRLLSVVGAGLGHDYPIRHAVRVRVSAVEPLHSPVYLFTEATEDEVHRTWEGIYDHYRPTGRAGR